MRTNQFVSAVVAVLLVTAGVAVSTAGSVAAAESTDGDAVLAATYDNGTVSVTATDNGTAIDNATVTANGVNVTETDANGTASFTWDGAEGEELSIAVDGENASVSGTWILQSGSLVAPEDVNPTLEGATISATYDNNTSNIEVAVVDDGIGVSNVSVSANNESVGETAEDGTLEFYWAPNKSVGAESEENETQTYEVDLVFEKNNTSRTETLTISGEEVREGPPTDMPEQVPDHVEEIHTLVGEFLNGRIDAPLGQLVSDVAGNDGGQADDRAKGHGNDSAQPEETDAGNETATDADDNPGNGPDGDRGNGNDGDRGNGNGQGNGNGEAKGHN